MSSIRLIICSFVSPSLPSIVLQEWHKHPRGAPVSWIWSNTRFSVEEQIWHLPRSKFLHRRLTLDELKCLYSNNLGRVKTFEELKNMMINSCGIHLTLSEAFELMKDQYPNLEENFNYVFNEISEAREQINLLRNKCDQLLEEIK